MNSKHLTIKTLLTAMLFSLLVGGVRAQMPNDNIYMPKGSICIGTMYTHSSWNHYWENNLKRENLNIGQHTTQSVMVMPAIGITDRINVVLSLPYVWTSTSAGNLMGQSGIQDLGAWLKVKAVEKKGFSVSALVGVSVPMGKYIPDFLPMSIGLQCRTVSGRILANYTHPQTRLYVTAHGTYQWRSNIRVDRSGYFADDRIYNTNEVRIPNSYDMGARFGILKQKWQTEIWVERNSCFDGDNIRRNDMPFPTNNTKATMVGWYGKFQLKALGMNARIGYVTDGLNMGQSTSYMVGVLYQFKFKKS